MATATAHPTGTQAAGCAHCSSALARDQEWCLECGTARTIIHRPPDWRIPVAIVGTVVLLALLALAIALVNLSSVANSGASATVTRTARSAAPVGPAISAWPVGLPGWTVVLATRRDPAAARATATRIAAAGISVGVLDTSQHPALEPGQWLVFSGRYPTRAAAAAQAGALLAKGETGARARLVARPGQ
jgi:SPOR domain